jgi:DNA-binding MarR family transcriptional regulator
MKDHVSRKRTIEQARETHWTLRMVRDRILARHRTIITSLTEGDKWPTLTPKQVHMLMTIREEGETSVKNLASRLFETPPSASVMVERLHEKKMVMREFDEDDRRKVVVALSPKGEQLVAKVEELFVESFADVLEEIGSEDAEKLTDVCVGIRMFLDRKA